MASAQDVLAAMEAMADMVILQWVSTLILTPVQTFPLRTSCLEVCPEIYPGVCTGECLAAAEECLGMAPRWVEWVAAVENMVEVAEVVVADVDMDVDVGFVAVLVAVLAVDLAALADGPRSDISCCDTLKRRIGRT